MDKRITRLANRGITQVWMFGKVHYISPGTWRIDHKTKTLVKMDDAKKTT